MVTKFKKGFSLVEVMILFAVLAVVMATALPILTKKSAAVPRKIPHGVYICRATDTENKVVQEYYNALTPLGTDENATKCIFNVPNANEFKIDLYSAGAGGTEFADFGEVPGEPSSDTFDKNDILSYITSVTNYNSLSHVNILRNLISSSISYVPKDNDFQDLFDNTTVTLNTYTASAGNGGDATIYYYSPADSYCMDYGSNIETMSPYRGKTNYRMDNYNYVSMQYDAYCREKDLEKPANQRKYNTTYWKNRPNQSRANTDDSNRNVIQLGGIGGRSKYMALEYKFSRMEVANTPADEEGNGGYSAGYNFYKTIEPDDTKDYKFLAYMADLIYNSFGHGYFAANCNGGITTESIDGTDVERIVPEIPSSCSSGYPSSASNGRSASNFSSSDYNSSAYTTVGDYKLIDSTTDGDNVTSYAAFRIPKFTSDYTGTPDYSNSSGLYTTIQTKMAIGGKKGIVGYQDNPVTEPPAPAGTTETTETASDVFTIYGPYTAGLKDFVHNFAYRVFRGSSPDENNIVTAEGATKADLDEDNNERGTYAAKYDAAVSGIKSDKSGSSDSGWAYYRVYSTDSFGSDSYPYAIFTSTLSKKNYQVGKAGGNGVHRTYRSNSLGATCEMTVPMGGPVLKENEIGNSARVTELENGLEVSITCRDSDGKTVFHQSLNGAKYTTNEFDTDEFTWSKEYNPDSPDDFKAPDFTVTPEDAVQMTYITPKWSKIWRNTIRTLPTYSISQGGNGTILKDKCTVAKGEFNMASYIGATKIRDGNNVTHDGMLDGYDCYPTQGNPKRKTLTEMRERPDFFEITEPTPGGPGAVIITW